MADPLLSFYDGVSRWLRPAVESLRADADRVLGDARERYAAMRGELPYVDDPKHTMAGSTFACAAMLAVFEVLRDEGVDAHAWGRAIQELPAAVPRGDESEARERAAREAEASQASARPNEFVFEILEGGDDYDRGMNVTSCAICHLFGRHDAMELVPYMCAFDDVTSRAGDQGLRRSGTIALGAPRCDFRFRAGGEPLPLATQYPDRIRLEGD